MDEIGFPIARDLDELHDLLLISIQQNRLLGRDQAMTYFGVNETGQSAERIADLIYQKYCEVFDGNTK